MDTVMIADLKANLSSYLSAVRTGKEIVVCDRSTPIARLVPIKSAQEEDLIVEDAPDPPSTARKYKSLNFLKKADLDRLLQEDRGDRELLR